MGGTFNEKTRLNAIINDPHFQGFGQKLSFMPEGFIGRVLGIMTIGRWTRIIPAWSHADIPNGLRAAAARVDQGIHIHHDIYTAEEMVRTPSKKDTMLLHFPAEKRGGPFALIMAGGAYATVATIIEAMPVAAALNELGIDAFVLRYRCGKKNPWPASSEDMHQAIKFILDRHDQFQIRKENYAVLGFSAGGHLAASFGTENYGYMKTNLPAPGALILSYPVICFDVMTKVMESCKNNVLGKNAGEKEMSDIHILKHIDKDYPSTFIWHCKDDAQVPFEANTQAFATKATELGIRCQLKAVGRGGHGLGIGKGSEAEGWLMEAVQFWLSSK